MTTEAPKVEEPKQEQNQEKLIPQEGKKELQTFFPDTQIQEKVNTKLETYKQTIPNIEESFTNYIKNNTDKIKIKNNLLERFKDNPERCDKLITAIIEESIKELNVNQPNTPNQTKESSQDISRKIENIPIIINTQEEIDSENRIQENQNKVEKNQSKVQENLETGNLGKENLEKIQKKLNEIEQDRQALLKNHPSLDIKPDYAKEQTKLKTSGTRDLLSNKGLSEDQINKYILFKETQKAIANDPSINPEESKDFLLSLKQLDNELNIPDASRDSFSEKNITTTSKELFDKKIGNQNLIETVVNQKTSHSSEYKELFDSKENLSQNEQLTNLIEKYGKFSSFTKPEQDLIKRAQHPDTAIQETKEDIQLKQTIVQRLESIKQSFDESTSESMEQSSILGPIMGLADYMDMDIGNQFAFNKSNDISIKDKKLSITGTIKNKPFALSTDLSKPSKLETSDFLNTSADQKTIAIGPDNRQATKFTLPGEQEIREKVKNTFKDNHENILKNSNSLGEYQQNIQNTFCENIKTLYGYKDLVQIRMEKQAQKDVAAQETLQLINTAIAPEGSNLFASKKSFSADTTNPQVFNFLKKIDNTLEDASIEELTQFRTDIKEFEIILKKVKSHEKEGSKNKIRGFLNETFGDHQRDISKNLWEGKAENEQSKLNIGDFFNIFPDKKDQKDCINTENFSKFIKETKNTEPDTSNIGETAYNAIERNKDLDETKEKLDIAYATV